MAISGLGVDGVFQIAKESTYGTAESTGFTDLPARPESRINSSVAMIENANQIKSRLKQDPDLGREIVSGELALDMAPDLMGLLMQLMLGDATSSGDTTTGYDHYWLAPDSGSEVGYGATIRQFIGGDLGDEFAGTIISGFSISQDNEGNAIITLRVTGQDQKDDDVARPSSVTVSTKIPFYFGNWGVSITPNGAGEITQKVDNVEIDVDLNYDLEKWQLGSANIQRPIFNGIPTVTMSMTIDAEKRFENWHREHKEFDVILTATSTELAGSSSGEYLWAIECPVCRLGTENNIENSNENLKMTLEFDGGYGGTTTNSGTTAKMFEIRVTDATATYA
jgi:hypothetical protein